MNCENEMVTLNQYFLKYTEYGLPSLSGDIKTARVTSCDHYIRKTARGGLIIEWFIRIK